MALDQALFTIIFDGLKVVVAGYSLALSVQKQALFLANLITPSGKIQLDPEN
jgi:hypothetical protein